MEEIMKAAITEGKGDVRIEEVAIPSPGPYQCLCRNIACATCSGTDMKIMKGRFPLTLEYPGILGHESIGRVVKKGEKVKYIKEGDVFFRPTAVYPGEKLDDFYSLWGGFAEYGLVYDLKAFLEDNPEEGPPFYTPNQQKIPSGLEINLSDATMIITLKEIFSFISKIGVKINSSVAILGTGPVAMAFVFFARLLGAYPVIVIGRRTEPLDYAKKLGADFTINNRKENMQGKVKEFTEGRKCNFVIDAAGDGDLMKESAQFLSPEGKIAPYATPHSMEYLLDRTKGPGEWTCLFTGPDENLAHDSMMGLIRLGVIPLKLFYSHKMPFTEIEEAFKLLDSKQAFKVILEMEENKDEN
jgi:threonine dehydrogenase-like Zn-dependent dehydrogenase